LIDQSIAIAIAIVVAIEQLMMIAIPQLMMVAIYGSNWQMNIAIEQEKLSIQLQRSNSSMRVEIVMSYVER
jgi:hypothetical protein